MYRWTGLLIAERQRDVVWRDPLAPLGSFTYIVTGRSPLTGAIILPGYRSMLVDGVIQVGGAEGNIYCYDFRIRPSQTWAGRMNLALNNPTTIQHGLLLDTAIEQTALAGVPSAQDLLLPRFWAGFQPSQVPEAEDTQEMREDIIAAQEEWEQLPGCRAEFGGVVTQVDNNGQDVAIEFNNGRVIELPLSAVLRPYVRQGLSIEPGMVLAMPVAPGHYRSYRELEIRNGPVSCRWLRDQVAKASDCSWGGLRIRRAEYIPSFLSKAKAVLEDASALLGDSWMEPETQNGIAQAPARSLQYCLPQVVPSRNLTGSCNWLSYDFVSLHLGGTPSLPKEAGTDRQQTCLTTAVIGLPPSEEWRIRAREAARLAGTIPC